MSKGYWFDGSTWVQMPDDDDGMRTECYPLWSHSWGPLLFVAVIAAVVIVVVT